ncbi:MAG: hypothetical protein ACTJG1_12380 [Enterococcus gilvus]
MKKILVLSFFVLVLLSGCGSDSSNGESSEASSSGGATTESSIRPTNNSSSGAQTSESPTNSTENSTTQTTSSEDALADTVSSSEFGGYATFYFNGMNVPDSININTTTNQLTFNVNTATQAVYNFTMENVPVRPIRLFSANTNVIRTVNVSTRLTIGSQLSGSTNVNNQSGALYLFHNANGGLSLATPNYAGNVPADQADVMIEVLQ